MYWYLNKETDEPNIFTSLMAIHKHTGIKYDTLTYHFSRNKRMKFEDDVHKIVRVEEISSKRN